MNTRYVGTQMLLFLVPLVAAWAANPRPRCGPGHFAATIGAIPAFKGRTPPRRGEPTVVWVVSYGDGCHRGGPTQVAATAVGYDVTPLDTAYLQAGCTRELRSFGHDVQLTFDDVGPAVVRVHGLVLDSAIAYERTIVIH